MGIYSNNPDYWKSKKPSSKGTSVSNGSNGNGNVEVIGFIETDQMFGHMMTTDPNLAREFKKYIRNVLKEARKNLSKDAKNYLNSDPRKAARAVKYAVYKTGFGGNISILQKGRGKAGVKIAKWPPSRKLVEGQRGGNRRLRADDGRNRLDYYYGADRGFILRFISSGTVPRTSRNGNRGMIRQTNWFGHTATWQIQTAADKVAEAINEYIRQETNG